MSITLKVTVAERIQQLRSDPAFDMKNARLIVEVVEHFSQPLFGKTKP